MTTSLLRPVSSLRRRSIWRWQKLKGADFVEQKRALGRD
jgi:hypothetical protein